MIYYLDAEIVRTEIHSATVKYFDKKHDPIAPFDTVNLNLLESALGQPRWDYYPTLEKKAAILFYGMIKNHPFHNGNKRIAVVTLITFLFVNGLEFDSFKVSNENMADMALKVALSDRSERNNILTYLEKWIGENVIYAEKSHEEIPDQ